MLSGPTFSSNPKPYKKIVVFLHGYGASGDDLIPLSYEWEEELPHTLFISPHAPYECEVSSFGYQWFGLKDFSPFNIRQGLDNAGPLLFNYLNGLLNEHQLTPKDLALVGFSQGAILSLEMLFYFKELGAIIGYSGAFFPPFSLQDKPCSKTPIFLVHGTADMVVPYQSLLHAQTHLSTLGVNVSVHTCSGLGHTIDETGIRLGGKFLKENLFLSNQTTSN